MCFEKSDKNVYVNTYMFYLCVIGTLMQMGFFKTIQTTATAVC